MFFAVELQTSSVYVSLHAQGLIHPPNHFMRDRKIALQDEQAVR